MKEYQVARKTRYIMRGYRIFYRFSFWRIMNEAMYQRKLIKKIERLLPGCYIIKNDPAENQGIPDILILFDDQWAMLEIKISSTASEQPNQSYYVDKFNDMSFAAFIYPQNEEQVLHDLQSTLGAKRQTCVLEP